MGEPDYEVALIAGPDGVASVKSLQDNGRTPNLAMRVVDEAQSEELTA